jgi:hypothetical protein
MEERIAEMKKQIGLWALILFFCFEHLKAQVSVTTWHNDNGRTGENISETHLNTGSFAHRADLDGFVKYLCPRVRSRSRCTLNRW